MKSYRGIKSKIPIISKLKESAPISTNVNDGIVDILIKENSDKQTIIIQCSPPHTGSTVLVNILYGLIAFNEDVIYSDIDNILLKKVKSNSNSIPIIKTHHCNIDNIMNKLKGYNVLFVCSERNNLIIDAKYKSYNNVVVINYNLLNETDILPINIIVDTVYNSLIDIIPRSIVLSKENAILRIQNMNTKYEEIKSYTFNYVDMHYHLHGSHRNRKKIIPDVPRIFWFNIHRDNYKEVDKFYEIIKNNYEGYLIVRIQINDTLLESVSNLLLKYDIIVITSTINFNDTLTNDRLLLTDTFTGLSELENSIKLIKTNHSYSIPIKLCIKRISPKRLLLVSAGGSAYSNILEYISKIRNTINDINNNDTLKHSLPCSNLLGLYKPTKIIYIYGDLNMSIRSLFRRRITCFHYTYFNNRINNNVLLSEKLYDKDYKSLPFTSFKEYIDIVIKTKTEPIGIIKHYEAWKKVPGVFFIHYEDFPKSDKVDEFLGIPNGTCSQFKLKERRSVRQPEETDEYLEIIKSLEPW